MAGASELLHPPPGIPAVAGYVYAAELWRPLAGTDQGDGTAATLVAGAGITPTATSIYLASGNGTTQATVTGGAVQVGVVGTVAVTPPHLSNGTDSVAVPGVAQDGSDITTPTAMPDGGAGIRGWLSAIWTKLNGTLAVTQTITGTFGYTAGVSGSPTIPGGAKVQTITAHCTTAGSLTINGGASIPIPANTTFAASYTDGKLTAPALVFTGTDSYYLDWLV